MSKSLEKNTNFIDVPRLFVPIDSDANDCVSFYLGEDETGDRTWNFEVPTSFRQEAAELLRDEAAARTIPEKLMRSEETALPSWLWKKKPASTKTTREVSIKAIFDRVVGSATYRGVKENLFQNEEAAKNFYDETRYALLQRFIALDIELLKSTGLEWAYGLTPKEKRKIDKKKASKDKQLEMPLVDPFSPVSKIIFSNTEIDGVLGYQTPQSLKSKWARVRLSKKMPHLTFSFSDITRDWEVIPSHQSRAYINVLAFRNNDGTLNGQKLKHACRLLVILLDLSTDNEVEASLGIGFYNLSSLLLACALPYDSRGAHALAASISSLVTSEAVLTSSYLAKLRGTHPDFLQHREKILRILRNQKRAITGEMSDFEKVTVLPRPFHLQDCPDLTLAAQAIQNSARALESVQHFGLRSFSFTTLKATSKMILFLECESIGISPLMSLCKTEASTSEKKVHPSLTEALHRLHYSSTEIKKIENHIIGHRTLKGAVFLNHLALKARGFTSEVLSLIESYIPLVNDLRLVFTPYVVGKEFCLQTLRVPAQKLERLEFDLLSYLGFSKQTIDVANLYCYGTTSLSGKNLVLQNHEALFVTSQGTPPLAFLKMAGAIQCFMSGEVEVKIPLPLDTPHADQQALLIEAWRFGIRSLTFVVRDMTTASEAEPVNQDPTRASDSPFAHLKPAPLPSRKPRLRAVQELVGLEHRETSGERPKRR